MGRFMMNKRHLLIAGMAVSLAGTLCASAYGQTKPKVTKVKDQPAKKDDTKDSAEPDKVLYQRAQASVQKGHYVEARLDFQTLINTYPDSEYLAKAKLGVADSFYKEGGTSSLTQSIEEYKNFIVFFPFLDEAQYAQMQVGMAHYKLMEKADRDNSHAEAAEDEFRTFLMKYPQSPYVPQAEQSMRNVQEVLAEGEFGVARFYYTKKDYRATAARLIEVTSRYPLFSSSDEAYWMLGDIYERARLGVKNEDAKNQFTDLAAKCYSEIVQNYPASSLAPGAKEHLKAMNKPIPAPNPDAIQRMKQQQMYEKQHHQLAVLRVPMGMVKSGPDVSLAAHNGTPNLAPPDDIVSATEVLQPNSTGPSFSIRQAGSSSGGQSGATGGTTADSESVETDDAASSATTGSSSTPATPAATPAAEARVPPPDDPPMPVVAAPAPTEPANAQPAVTSEAPAAEAVVATPAPEEAQAATASTSSQGGTSTAQTPPAASSTSTTPKQADKADPSTESTSKKKKGLHKIIPF
jgi:outer membrane protein assembly factor BamD